MSKRQIIMICGVIVALMPFTGFPSSWSTFITVILGLIIIAIAYKMSPISTSTTKPSSTTIPSPSMPFVDHTATVVSAEKVVEVNNVTSDTTVAGNADSNKLV